MIIKRSVQYHLYENTLFCLKKEKKKRKKRKIIERKGNHRKRVDDNHRYLIMMKRKIRWSLPSTGQLVTRFTFCYCQTNVFVSAKLTACQLLLSVCA